MDKFLKLFTSAKPAVIGMIHVSALPGSPRYGGSMLRVVEKACQEAEIYKKSNVDGIIIENMHDIPYVKKNNFGPEVVSSMTKVCAEVKRVFDSKPIGVQILAGGNKEAIAVANSCGLDFIRAECFVFGHVGDEGYLDASAGLVLRYRKLLECQNVLIFTDIKKKHSSHSITSDVSLEENAKAAEFFLSDGLIITGSATGCPADANDVKNVKSTVGLPVLVGSGVDIDNVEKYLNADAFIVGSYFKNGGKWEEEISQSRVTDFMDKIIQLRNKIPKGS